MGYRIILKQGQGHFPSGDRSIVLSIPRMRTRQVGVWDGMVATLPRRQGDGGSVGTQPCIKTEKESHLSPR